MKQNLYWFIKWLLYSNVFIAICAMTFTLQAYYILHLQVRYDTLILLSGFSTLFTYLLIRVASTKRIEEYEPDVRWVFFLERIRLMRIITGFAFLMCVVLFLFLKKEVQIALIIPGIVSLAYGIPIKFGSKETRIRDIGIAKIFLISFVWAYTGSVLPVVNAGVNIFSSACLILFAANFFFIFGITLPFDIKDLKIDAMHDVRTIPKFLGVENTYTLSFILLFISGALHIYLQRSIFQNEIDYSVPLGVSILATGMTVFLTTKKMNNFLFFGLLDGMILLQFVLCWFYQRVNA